MRIRQVTLNTHRRKAPVKKHFGLRHHFESCEMCHLTILALLDVINRYKMLGICGVVCNELIDVIGSCVHMIYHILSQPLINLTCVFWLFKKGHNSKLIILDAHDTCNYSCTYIF